MIPAPVHGKQQVLASLNPQQLLQQGPGLSAASTAVTNIDSDISACHQGPPRSDACHDWWTRN